MALITDVEKVKDHTGAAVSSPDITRAQTIIEISCGRVLGNGRHLRARDRHFARLAVEYQAAFMQSRPDLFGQMDVASLSQGDLAVTMRDERSSLYLAPLARASLRQCRWQGSRSISVNSAFLSDPSVDDEPDDLWTPLEA